MQTVVTMVKRNQKLFILTCGVCFILLLILINIFRTARSIPDGTGVHPDVLGFYDPGLEFASGSIKDLKTTFHYCTPNAVYSDANGGGGNDRYTSFDGEEGHSFEGHQYFELNHVAITIRHGDRNAIHLLPHDAANNNIQYDNGADSTEYFDRRALAFRDLLGADRIAVRPVVRPAEGESTAVNNLEHYLFYSELRPPLEPGGATNIGGAALTGSGAVNELDNAQLTTRGFMQHVSLGRYLHARYSGSGTGSPGAFTSLLDPVVTPRSGLPGRLYVRATNYDRTIQSAAALLLGMFPVLSGGGELAGGESPVAMWVDGNEELEPMHGVGLRTARMQRLKTDTTTPRRPESWRHPGRPASEAAPDDQMAFDNGCGAAFRLAMRQQKHNLETPVPASNSASPQRHCAHHAPEVCAAVGDEAYLHHYLSRTVLRDAAELQAGTGPETEATRAKNRGIHSMAITEMTDAVLVPLCHYTDDESNYPRDVPIPAEHKSSAQVVSGTRSTMFCKPGTTSHGPDGPCVPLDFLPVLKTTADHTYCRRFADPEHGGLDATRLAMYPLLVDILAHLRSNAAESAFCAHQRSGLGLGRSAPHAHVERWCTATATATNSEPSSESTHADAAARATPMSVFSGHDTVIMPLLAALGVFDNPNARSRSPDKLWCEWAPYASRVVFELYTPSAAGSDALTLLSAAGAAAQASGRLGVGKVNAERMINAERAYGNLRSNFTGVGAHISGANGFSAQPYVRLLYNGHAVTHTIDACRSFHAAASRAPSGRQGARRRLALDRSLCPLSVVEEVIERLLAVSDTAPDPNRQQHSDPVAYDPAYRHVNERYREACVTNDH